jgi:hypothetical protein
MGLEYMELTFLEDDRGTHCYADCYAFGLWRRCKEKDHWRSSFLPGGTVLACYFAFDLSSLYAHYRCFVETIQGLSWGLMLKTIQMENCVSQSTL